MTDSLRFEDTTPNEVLLDDELHPMVVFPKTYWFFQSHGREGLDALALYLHLMATALLQNNRRVFATDSYLRQGLAIGQTKLVRMKAFLARHGLIGYFQERDQSTGRYISKANGGRTFIHVMYKSFDVVASHLETEAPGTTATMETEAPDRSSSLPLPGPTGAPVTENKYPAGTEIPCSNIERPHTPPTRSSTGEEKKKRLARRTTADATHPTLDVPMNQKRYDHICAEDGKATVDRAIQSRLDWEASKGKAPAKDYAAAAATWIANEQKWSRNGGVDAILDAI